MIITIRIKFEIKELKFKSLEKDHFNKNYEVKIIIYTFNFIPILKLTITNKKIKKTLSNEKVRKIIIKNQLENIELSTLRDWLLPMLMNGQATISD